MHQTEALIGILLSSKDSRAKSVLEDLAEVSRHCLVFVLFVLFVLFVALCLAAVVGR